MSDYDITLLPTPRSSCGGALRLETLPYLKSLGLDDPEVIRHKSGSVVGERRTLGGVLMVPVLFTAWSPEPAEFLVHINSFTDSHREDFTPSLLERIGDSPLYAGVFLLPSDGIISYTIANVSGLDRSIGCERSGWRKVHQLGQSDPENPDRLPNPLGADGSVWTGPDAQFGNWPQKELSGWVEVESQDRTISVFPGDARALVLFDAQFWSPLAPAAGIRAAGYQHTIILIPSLMEQREADLTDSAAAADLVRRALQAAESVTGSHFPRANALAGQSYGGLAVAGVAKDYPELIETGVVQSGSLWYPYPPNDEEPPVGKLVKSLRSGEGDVSVPLFIQVGSEEGQMVDCTRAYRDALRARGADPLYREFRGGHDYAWWRYGLIAALDGLC